MDVSIPGIHHITAIASDPQRNVDFYTDVLGLRLVKLTVNFDDPTTYHLYYGDDAGTPGTILTFFPWPGARRGRRGNGQVAVTSFSIPEGSIGYWQDRLKRYGVAGSDIQSRFDETVLTVEDPDGMWLELVAHAGTSANAGWTGGTVPMEYAIRGFYGATVWVHDVQPTAELVGERFGFQHVDDAGTRHRFMAPGDTVGGVLDIVHRPNGDAGRGGAGTVHHIAWRTADDEEQLAWRAALTEAGLQVTPVRDRQYFRSIYFREPGGVLFEIATDLPGFTLDESVEELGTHLKLPPWLEAQREQISRRLPALRIPERV